MPPNILDENSTQSAVAVRENQNITLTCKADGFPAPKLMWRREDGQGFTVDRRKKGKKTHLLQLSHPETQMSEKSNKTRESSGQQSLAQSVNVNKIISTISHSPLPFGPVF